MSIATDIRAYADTALEQGKQVVGQAANQAVSQAAKAQQQFAEVTGNANEFVGKLADSAKDNVATITGRATELRAQAEKALPLSTLRAAVEPYLTRAESLYGSVKSDQRVAKVLDSAEALGTFVIDTVTERIVKPARSVTGLGARTSSSKSSAKSTSKSSGAKASTPRRTTKPAATRPAAKTAPKSAAKKAAPAKSATAAKKSAPAKKSSSTS